AGRTVAFEVVGSRLGQDFDPVVTIRDATGRQVASRDNDVGLCFDCRFSHTFEAAGTYIVEVRDSRFRGSDRIGYILRMGSFPVARVSLPSTVRPGERTALVFPQLGREPLEWEVPIHLPAGPFYFGFRRARDEASAWLPLQVGDAPGVLE